jgi:hypothetical protein
MVRTGRPLSSIRVFKKRCSSPFESKVPTTAMAGFFPISSIFQYPFYRKDDSTWTFQIKYLLMI